jgi:hypothetical protein
VGNYNFDPAGIAYAHQVIVATFTSSLSAPGSFLLWAQRLVRLMTDH